MLTLLLVHGALAADPLWNLAPFGIGVYLHDRPLRGAIYTTTQAAGLGGAIASSVMLGRAADDGDVAGMRLWQDLTTGFVVLGAASYAAALVDGGRLHDLETEDRKASVRAWDASRTAALEERGR